VGVAWGSGDHNEAAMNGDAYDQVFGFATPDELDVLVERMQARAREQRERNDVVVDDLPF